MESPQWSCSQPLIDPLFGDTTTVRAPAASSAFLGSVSSIRSTPSVARIATFLPCNCCAAITPPCENLDHSPPTNRQHAAGHYCREARLWLNAAERQLTFSNT